MPYTNIDAGAASRDIDIRWGRWNFAVMNMTGHLLKKVYYFYTLLPNANLKEV
jgi:hypothetical protein